MNGPDSCDLSMWYIVCSSSADFSARCWSVYVFIHLNVLFSLVCVKLLEIQMEGTDVYGNIPG